MGVKLVLLTSLIETLFVELLLELKLFNLSINYSVKLFIFGSAEVFKSLVIDD